MSPRGKTQARSKGHPRGGLFFAAAALAAALPVSACAPAPITGQAVPTDLTHEGRFIPDAPGVYRNLGYVAGERGFPVVGKFVFLPGPADSTYAIFALSLPNSALRFRRDPPDFVARYAVQIIVGDTAAPITGLSETQEVRVGTFRETARRDESVVFQGFLTLAPGQYDTSIEVRDLAATAGLTTRAEISVPRFGARFVTTPIMVYEAQPRADRSSPPALITNPRSTVDLQSGAFQLYVESSAQNDTTGVLEIRDEGEVIFTDTLTFEPSEGQLHVSLITVDGPLLPPGNLAMKVNISGTAGAASGDLLVALSPDWVVADYAEALSYLRYAGSPAELDSLTRASVGERARLLHALWSKRDDVPETAENEFFERYFRRMRDANDRFGESDVAGWLSDRGAVYITLGPPDQVLRHLEPAGGTQQSQVWVYHAGSARELRLVFTDPMMSGAFRLTTQSRREFQLAVSELYS